MVLKRLIARCLKASGIIAVPQWRWQNWTKTEDLRRLARKGLFDGVLDVGANVGQFVGYLRKDAELDLPIVSFEPIPENVRKLRAIQQDFLPWEIYEMGLGPVSSTMQLHVAESTVFSSFLEGSEKLHREYEHSRTVDQVEVRVEPLDGLMDEIRQKSGSQKFLLKLDTQGYDFEVLKGAADSLDSISAILIEMSCQSLYENSLRCDEAMQKLMDLEYMPVGFYPVTRDMQGVLTEMDCPGKEERHIRSGWSVEGLLSR